jgi:hypothetical protein
VTDGKWHFVVGTYGADGVARIYVDGVLGASAARTAVLNSGVATTAGVCSNCGGGQDYFNGSIDDVRIYNRALSVTEVKQLYNAGR